MATTRPFVDVSRGKVRSYVFLGQEHPFISKGKIIEDASASCQPCHRAEGGGGLPSRLRGRTFSHDSHLPAAPSDADCKACHTTVSSSSSALDLTVIETKTCATCHRGDPLQLEFDDKEATKKVVGFPHASHLTAKAKDGGVLGCVSCHVAAQNGVATVGTLEAAANCTSCHDHGKAPRITGGKDRDYVASCRKCHGDAGLSDGAEVADERVAMGSFGGGQFHPDTESKSCKSCHRTIELQFETRSEPHIWAELSYAQGRFHGVSRSKGGNEDCFGCHWVELIDNRVPQGFSGDRSRAGLNGLANELRGYPGRPK
jgi:predicted CXXCH cytochrome family protein